MQNLQQFFQAFSRLFVWLVIVAPWEQALRVRLGKRVRLLDAGTYLVVPFVDRVYRQSTRRRLSIVSPQTLTTSDGRSITIGSAVGYEIRDLAQLYKTLHDADDTIEASVAALVAGYVAHQTLDNCTAMSIEFHVLARLGLERYGLAGTEFYITNLAVAKSTYRMITDNMRNWKTGSRLNTEQHEGQEG